jgi:membrane protease YdiL (CAAX protease family)
MVSALHFGHIVAAVGAFIGWALTGLFGLRRLGVDLRDPSAQFDDLPLLFAGLVNIAVAATVLLFFVLLDGGDVSDLGWAWGGRHVGAALAITSVTFTLSFGYVFASRRVAETSARALRAGGGTVLLGAVALALAAWQEEVVFRAYVLANLRTLPVVVAAIGSAIVFTAVHFVTSRGGMFQTVSWILGGLSLATVYLLSGSIWLATVAHLVRNLANVMVLTDEQPLALVVLDEPLTPAQKTTQHAAQSLAIVAVTWLFFGGI